MEKPPAFQFYPKDFLSDEDQAVMSCEQAGAYIRLICHAWNEGSIPDDAVKCARLAGSEPKRFTSQIWPSVRPCFRLKEGDRLVHLRLEREFEKQREFSARQRDKGIAGAKARYSRGHASAIAQAEPNASSSVFSLQTAVSTPPNPPQSGGRRLTAGELEKARKHIASIGGCPHGVTHSVGECARLLASSWRGEAVSA